MALSKVQRLSKEKDIARVYQGGQKWSSPFFRIFFYRSKLKHSRYAVVVSKKVSKKATERNTLKRRIVSWIARTNPLKEDKAFDCIIFVSPRATTLARKHIYEELEGIFRRVY